MEAQNWVSAKYSYSCPILNVQIKLEVYSLGTVVAVDNVTSVLLSIYDVNSITSLNGL